MNAHMTKSHLQHLTWKFESTSFYIGLWLTIKDEFTKFFPNLCWNKIVINFCKEIVCCGSEREVIKYLTSNITIHLFPVYNIKKKMNEIRSRLHDNDLHKTIQTSSLYNSIFLLTTSCFRDCVIRIVMKFDVYEILFHIHIRIICSIIQNS